jgi:hypothetical protein
MFALAMTALAVTSSAASDAKTAETQRLTHLQSLRQLKEELDKHTYLRDRYIIFPIVGENSQRSLSSYSEEIAAFVSLKSGDADSIDSIAHPRCVQVSGHNGSGQERADVADEKGVPRRGAFHQCAKSYQGLHGISDARDAGLFERGF